MRCQYWFPRSRSLIYGSLPCHIFFYFLQCRFRGANQIYTPSQGIHSASCCRTVVGPKGACHQPDFPILRSSSSCLCWQSRRCRFSRAAASHRIKYLQATFCCRDKAAAGIKGGVVHSATDELGFHAIENRHYVTDIHATVLHQLGLDPRRLEVPGQKRLEIDFGQPIREIMLERTALARRVSTLNFHDRRHQTIFLLVFGA